MPGFKIRRNPKNVLNWLGIPGVLFHIVVMVAVTLLYVEYSQNKRILADAARIVSAPFVLESDPHDRFQPFNLGSLIAVMALTLAFLFLLG
ncbi:hypothetical protein KL911_001561 [Ogataea haglerorum]|uniref:uncharacterized protein n=1 Tax=Ogataea haglerorum TaxID=1937702 RepID=UPI001C894098|nr:uncharacterized protein KL911_001561 [Ogataea haglerorum]KAG7755504.1 hypothetical protein KL911_001561 [Ogataea haglerorum]